MGSKKGFNFILKMQNQSEYEKKKRVLSPPKCGTNKLSHMIDISKEWII